MSELPGQADLSYKLPQYLREASCKRKGAGADKHHKTKRLPGKSAVDYKKLLHSKECGMSFERILERIKQEAVKSAENAEQGKLYVTQQEGMCKAFEIVREMINEELAKNDGLHG